MADELAELRQQVADLHAKLDAITAATPRPAQPFLELTFSGPARNRDTAAAALEQAGYTTSPVAALYDDDPDDGWVETRIPWTREGPVTHDFQADHAAKAADRASKHGYTLRASGVAAGQLTR